MKKIFLFIFLFPIIKIYADEVNTNPNLIELKIPIQQNLKNEPTIKTIKIDDNTEAKITISSEKIDTKKIDFLKNNIIELNNKIEDKTEEYKKNVLTVEKEKNISTQQEIVKKTPNLVEDKKITNIIDNKKTEQKTDQINDKVQENVVNNNENNKDKTFDQEITIKGNYKNNQQSVIKIKDGARNININFQPNIITSNKQQKKGKVIKKTKNTGKNNIKKSKIKSGVIVVKDQKKNITKSTNNTVIKDKKQKENYTTKNDKKEEERQNIYIINRFINLDENTQLTDEMIKSISADDENNINVNNNNKNSLSAYSKNDNKFKQKYDLMVENTVPYGEVAFVEDYNS